MTEPATITTTHDSPLFDPEDHRKEAAAKLGVQPDQIHCIGAADGDGVKEISPATHSQDGTLLQPRVLEYTRVTTWEVRPQPQKQAAPPPPEEPGIAWPEHTGQHRGVRLNAPVTIDGKTEDRDFISTGASFVLANSPEGRAVVAQLDKEHKDHQATLGTPPVGN
jgi:hypothetical protein